MLTILPKMSPGQRVTLDGYEVPRVEVAEDAATGKWHVRYDDRFAIMADNLEELQRWLWIVATAQAVGEGYSCHGENSVYRPNPHKRKIMCIGSIETAAPMGSPED
jgi:hypothetical protein